MFVLKFTLNLFDEVRCGRWRLKGRMRSDWCVSDDRSCLTLKAFLRLSEVFVKELDGATWFQRSVIGCVS